MSGMRFLFGTGGNGAYAPCGAEGTQEIFVTQPFLYEPEQGWGFVTEKNRREQESLRLPELNSGFEPVWWYQDEDITGLDEQHAHIAMFLDYRCDQVIAACNRVLANHNRKEVA